VLLLLRKLLLLANQLRKLLLLANQLRRLNQASQLRSLQNNCNSLKNFEAVFHVRGEQLFFAFYVKN
jgi:hypothetical protein